MYVHRQPRLEHKSHIMVYSNGSINCLLIHSCQRIRKTQLLERLATIEKHCIVANQCIGLITKRELLVLSILSYNCLLQ